MTKTTRPPRRPHHATWAQTATSATLAAALGLLSACGSDDDPTTTPAAPTPASATQDIQVRFTARAGDAPVRCGDTLSGLGLTQTAAQLQDLRFYVSGVKLLKADGSSVPLTLRANDDWNYTQGDAAVTLIDLEDATNACANNGEGSAGTNAVISGTVPTGTYTGVQFTLGVPFAFNHTDETTAPSPLNLQALGWGWQMGRRYAKIEFADPAGATGSWSTPAFYVHLGATGCTGNPATGETVACESSNRADVTLPAFDPTTQTIALDVKALVASEDITNNGGGAPGCMSGKPDPECDTIFPALGLDLATGTSTGTATAFKAVTP